MPWIKRGINRFIPSVIWQPSPQVPITLKEMSADGVILDIGAGGRQIAPHVLGVDSIPFVNTCLVADIHNLPFVDNSVDGIFCTGTLEHVEDPDRAMSEMHRILRMNCLIHLEVPFIQPLHKDPQDYWRWTLDGLRLFTRQHKFDEVRSGIHLGPTSAINALVIAYWQSWFHNRYIRKVIDLVLSWMLFPFKYLDVWLIKRTNDMPAGIYYVGRKGSTISGASTFF
jgi:SAM-dependent methyltransferase